MLSLQMLLRLEIRLNECEINLLLYPNSYILLYHVLVTKPMRLHYVNRLQCAVIYRLYDRHGFIALLD